MKTIIRFKIWDTKEKCYLMRNNSLEDIEFSNKEMADEYRFDYLQKGNYPDEPITVLQIHEFNNDKFAGCFIG